MGHFFPTGRSFYTVVCYSFTSPPANAAQLALLHLRIHLPQPSFSHPFWIHFCKAKKVPFWIHFYTGYTAIKNK